MLASDIPLRGIGGSELRFVRFYSLGVCVVRVGVTWQLILTRGKSNKKDVSALESPVCGIATYCCCD